MVDLPDGLSEALDHLGRLRWDQFVELALYAPASGFFATAGRAGRRGGDFITSPEVGPLFGAVVARRLDAVWESLGRPERFTVVEAGAGRGALAISVRAAEPSCATALHWVLVERSATMRADHAEHLELVDGPGAAGAGPWFSSTATLPERPLVGAVVANELLDNLPFRLMERRDRTWWEVVLVRDARASLTEELTEAPAELAVMLDDLAPGAGEGARVPWQQQAARFVERATGVLEAGLVVAFDFTDTTGSLAGRPQSDWLRTYRSHHRGAEPLEAPGTQDITVEVAVDQLPVPTTVSTQREWLRANGIDDLVAAAAAEWAERAGVGDLAAIRARSAVVEAEALLDAGGLGAFSVLEWQVGASGAVGTPG